MKTISLKKVSAVAVASLGFGLLSVVPANAAVITQAYSVVATAPTVNTTSTTASAALAQVTATLKITTTGNITANKTMDIAPTFKLLDPNGVDVTSTATCAAVAANGGLTPALTSGCAFTGQFLDAGSAIAAGTFNVGTIIFTPTMGGLYTMTVTAAAGVGQSGTDTMAALTAGTAVSNSMHVSGIRVSQGTTRGATGAAKLGNQAQVFVLLPAQTDAKNYKFTSSGVGAITGATAANGTNTNISGVSTDFSAGLTTVTGANTTLSTQLLTLTNAATAGVQTITVTTIDTTTGLASALYSTTITWSAIAALSPGASIVRIAPTGTAAIAQGATPSTTNAYTSALDAIPYSAPRATGNQPATIQVILVNNDGTAATQGHKVTASVSGSGFVLVDNSGAAANGTSRSSTATLTAGTENVAWVHISGDGTAGTGTIGLTVTDAVSGVTTALPSKTVTFYGSVTKLAVTTTNFTIGKAGSTTGGAAAARVSANEIGDPTNTTSTVTSGTTTPAFIVTATDSGGRNVTTGSVPTVKSSDANVVSGGTCILDDGSNADYSATRSNANSTSVGVYNCNFTSAANAASGSKATLTISVADPASTTGGTLTTTLAVTIGGSISTETLAFDKTSYAPGDAMVITRTAKDSAGNPVFDGASAGAVSFNKAVGGTAPGTGVYIGGVSASATSVAKSKVFAPSIPGALTATMTGGDAAATVRTASATVTDANAGLLTQIDALNAKIVALNALIAKIMKKLGVK